MTTKKKDLGEPQRATNISSSNTQYVFQYGVQNIFQSCAVMTQSMQVCTSATQYVG